MPGGGAVEVGGDGGGDRLFGDTKNDRALDGNDEVYGGGIDDLFGLGGSDLLDGGCDDDFIFV